MSRNGKSQHWQLPAWRNGISVERRWSEYNTQKWRTAQQYSLERKTWLKVYVDNNPTNCFNGKKGLWVWWRYSSLRLFLEFWGRHVDCLGLWWHTGCPKKSTNRKNHNQNCALWGQILPCTWLGRAQSCLVLVRTGQKIDFWTQGSRLLVTEPVHCGSSRVLKVLFLGHPEKYF